MSVSIRIGKETYRLLTNYLGRVQDAALLLSKDRVDPELLKKVGSPLQSYILYLNQFPAGYEVEIQKELDAFEDRILRKPFTPKWAIDALKRELAIRTDFDEIDVRPIDETLRCRDAAFGLIRAAWPEAFSEVQLCTHRMIFYPGKIASGGSTPRTFGAFYCTDHNDPMVKYASSLIHESAHHFLNILRIEDRLMESPYDELIYSPLRRENRPAWRVVHAAFVMARIQDFLDRALKSAPENKGEILKELLEYDSTQAQTLKNLSRVKWTAFGKDLWDYMHEMLATSNRMVRDLT